MATNASAQTAPQRVIIDTDPGVDDAMAILLALNSPELKVEALTVVPGNVEAAQGLENALKIVSLAGRCDVTVAAGGADPPQPQPSTPPGLERPHRPPRAEVESAPRQTA